jgi:hypothetical protein
VLYPRRMWGKISEGSFHYFQSLYDTGFIFTMTEGDSLPKRIAVETSPGEANLRESVVTFSDSNTADVNNFRGGVVTFNDVNPVDAASSTEGDCLSKGIAVETSPDEHNLRNSVVTFEGANPADDKNNFRESVVTFSDANPIHAAGPLRSSSSTTRTIVVDATTHLEAGSTSSGKLIPGVRDVTKGVHDVVTSAKHCVRIFRVDNEIFEVNEEQLDRVRMSKCELEGVSE